jgi:hypothetical protein
MNKAYITVEDVENMALVDVVDSFEPQIDEWIIAMSNQVSLLTNREWLADDTEYPEVRYFDGTGNSYLRIGEAVDIDSIEVGEDYGENFTAVTDYITTPYNSSPITKLVRKDGVWDRGIKNIKVTGNFGYATEVPVDIKFAVAVLVAGIINAQSNQEGEIQSEKIGNYAVTYSTDEQKQDYKRAMDIIQTRRVILL